MTCDLCGGLTEEQRVTYRLELDNRLMVVEHVPARVCLQCGERVYAAEVVDRLQQTAWSHRVPSRLLETPVFDYAAG